MSECGEQQEYNRDMVDILEVALIAGASTIFILSLAWYIGDKEWRAWK